MTTEGEEKGRELGEVRWEEGVRMVIDGVC